jgi:hypothetical protein
MADAEVYGDLADHFANRRVARLADAENLSQVLSDVQKKLVTLEEEAAKYRSTTGKATALHSIPCGHAVALIRRLNQAPSD